MSEPMEQPKPPKPSRRRSLWPPLVLIVGMGAFYWLSQSGSKPLEGWSDDLTQAMAQVGSSGQRILVYFSSSG